MEGVSAMTLVKIISGGQTGADQGALLAAKDLGLRTGGWIPRGWRTDEGARPDFAATYGMIEHSSHAYPPRTLCNVMASDATLIFGHDNSPGCKLTRAYANKHNKPVLNVNWPISEFVFKWSVEHFASWLIFYGVKTLNVAGNRERTNPGIADVTRRYIVAVVTQMRLTQRT